LGLLINELLYAYKEIVFTLLVLLEIRKMHFSESSAKIRHQSNTTALHTIAQQTTTSRMHLQTQ
jgi:hypothetical protein